MNISCESGNVFSYVFPECWHYFLPNCTDRHHVVGMLIMVHAIILNRTGAVDKIVNMPTRYPHSIQFFKYLCKLLSCSGILWLWYSHLTVFISRFTLNDKTRLKLEEYLRKTADSQLTTQSGIFPLYFYCLYTFNYTSRKFIDHLIFH